MFKLLQLLTIGSKLSPEMRTVLHATIDQLAAEAAKSPGSTDDQVVTVLKTLCILIGAY